MGFVLFCFDVLKIYSGINASLELSSFPSILFFFPSILFEKPTHTVSQMFWSFGKHGVYNWEHLRCIISQMIVLCHFAWVFYFSCHLSPFSPPASFLRRKSPSMSGQTALSSSASKCWPSNPAPSSFAHWRHPPRLCKNPFWGPESSQDQSPSLLFFPPRSREGSGGHYIIRTLNRK